MVHWAILRGDLDKNGKATLKAITAKREVNQITLETTAAEAKKIKEEYKGDMDAVVVAMRHKFHNELASHGWYTSDLEAIFEARKSVLKKLEIQAMKYEYDDSVDARKFFYEAAVLLRSVREFARILAFYKNAVDEKILILPDMTKFTVKDRKFVPKSPVNPETKPAPKKPVAKK